ncbi:MAG: tetratricopeptide repeat protein [Acidobacteria bacterium]|nr:tetratricopeptide repeat protein [Acidobacteriota bacterium]
MRLLLAWIDGWLPRFAVCLSLLFACPVEMPAVQKTPGGQPNESKPAAADQTSAKRRAEAYYHFSLARNFEESGNFLNAVDEYRKAIQQDPQSPHLYIELANAFLRNRQMNNAIREAENAVRVDPENLEAHRLLGTIYYNIVRNEDSGRVPASSEYLKKAIQEYEKISSLDGSDTNSLVVLSLLYRYDGQAGKAVETAKRLLDKAPSSEAGLANLAQIYSEQGNTQDAINVFKKALEVNPKSPRILEQMAIAYEQVKDYSNAIEAYRKAMALDEDSLELRKGLAQALLDNKQYEEAEKEFLKILEADPDEGVAYFRLAQIYKNRREFDKALTHYNKAGSILVGSLEISFNIGLLYEELGRYEKAEERFQQLLKLTEKPAGNYSASEKQNRGAFLTHAGYLSQQLEKYPQAIAYFTELKTMDAENAARSESYIIGTYRASKQLDKALAVSTDSVKAHPEDKDLQLLQADLLSESGKGSQAIERLQKLLEVSEEDAKVYSAMIQVYQRDKKFKDAAKTLLAAERFFQNKEGYHFMLGSIYERQKEYDKAEKTFKKVIELNPKHAAALNYLGYMLADRGVRLEESMDLIKKAVDLDPNNGAYLDSLGWACFKLNRLDEAETYLKKARDRVRKDPTIHEHLGDIYYQKGQYAEARTAWEFSLANGQDEEEIRKVQKKIEDLKVKLASLEKK